MLRGLHKASSTWLGKLVMAVVVLFLVGAFAIWGINDIFRGFGQNEVASVGSTTISTEPMLASQFCPKPRKMSLMPQMPNAATSSVTTTAMMILPIQFAEAFRIPRSMLPSFGQRGVATGHAASAAAS